MTQQFATQQDLEDKSRMTEQRIAAIEQHYRALEQRVDSNASAVRDVESELRRKPWESNINLELFALTALGSFWILLIALIVKDRG